MDDISDPQPDASDEFVVDEEHLKRLARRIVTDDAAADDVLQEAWLAALLQRPGKVKDVRRWLWTATRFESLRRARGERRRKRREEFAAPPEAIPGPDEIVARADSRRYLAQAVDDLGEPSSKIVRMRFVDGLTSREIAERLGASENTVKSQARRGLIVLRERLEKEYGFGRKLGLALVFAFDWDVSDLPVALASRAQADLERSPWWTSPRTVLPTLTGLALLSLAIWAPRTISRTAGASAPVAQPSRPEVSAPAPIATDRMSVVSVPPAPAPDPAASERFSGQAVLVVDETDLPVEGAEILVAIDSIGRDYEVRAISDEYGRAVVPVDGSDLYPLGAAVADARLIGLLARAPGRVASGVLLIPHVTDEAVHLQVGGLDRVVYGRIIDSAGTPVPDVSIYVGSFDNTASPQDDGRWESRATCSARSAADGTYRVTGISPGLHPVVAKKDDWAQASGRVDVHFEHEASCDLSMLPGAVLRGQVFDQDGRPLAGAWVLEDMMQKEFAAQSRTDEEGRYELLSLDPKPNRFFVQGANWTWDELLWTPKPGQERVFDFHLRTGRELSLRVVDSHGAPIPRVSVRFAASIPVTWRRWVTTDEEGRARTVGAPVGPPLQALVLSPAGDTQAIAQLEWPAPDGEEKLVIYYASPAGLATIAGVCLQHDGTLWGSAQVTATEVDSTMRRTTELDPVTGAFELSVGAGPVVVELIANERGATQLAELVLSEGERHDLGILRCEKPGWLEIDCSFDGDPSAYRHTVVYGGVGQGKDVVVQGTGFPPQRLELLRGDYAVQIERGPKRYQPRGGLVRAGHTLHQRLSPDTPVRFGFYFRAPPGCTDHTSKVLLTRLAIGAQDLPDEHDPIDEHFAAMLAPEAIQTQSITVDRGPDGWFSCELDMAPGNWNVLAETASGWLATHCQRIGPTTFLAFRECELVRPE